MMPRKPASENAFKRATVGSYIDFGTLRIPPIPQGIVLTDRDDGTLWLLSYSTAEESEDGLGYISINDAIPPARERYVYDAYDEPKFHGTFRLLVRGGYLGYELIPRDPGTTKPVFAVKAASRSYREIYVPESWQRLGDVLAWRDFEV